MCSRHISLNLYNELNLWLCMVDGWFMVFNATFNNISVISWRSVLLVGESGVPGENNRPVASHWQTLSHNLVSCTTLTALMVIGTDCTCSCKSNYHAITTTTDNINMHSKKTVQYTSVWFFSIFHRLITLWLNKGNNKITELRTIL